MEKLKHSDFLETENIFENWFQFLFLPGYVRSLHVLVHKVGQGRMELAHRRVELKRVDA